MTREDLDVAALYERHADHLLMFPVRRTADVDRETEKLLEIDPGLAADGGRGGRPVRRLAST